MPTVASASSCAAEQPRRADGRTNEMSSAALAWMPLATSGGHRRDAMLGARARRRRRRHGQDCAALREAQKVSACHQRGRPPGTSKASSSSRMRRPDALMNTGIAEGARDVRGPKAAIKGSGSARARVGTPHEQLRRGARGALAGCLPWQVRRRNLEAFLEHHVDAREAVEHEAAPSKSGRARGASADKGDGASDDRDAGNVDVQRRGDLNGARRLIGERVDKRPTAVTSSGGDEEPIGDARAGHAAALPVSYSFSSTPSPPSGGARRVRSRGGARRAWATSRDRYSANKTAVPVGPGTRSRYPRAHTRASYSSAGVRFPSRRDRTMSVRPMWEQARPVVWAAWLRSVGVGIEGASVDPGEHLQPLASSGRRRKLHRTSTMRSPSHRSLEDASRSTQVSVGTDARPRGSASLPAWPLPAFTVHRRRNRVVPLPSRTAAQRGQRSSSAPVRVASDGQERPRPRLPRAEIQRDATGSSRASASTSRSPPAPSTSAGCPRGGAAADCESLRHERRGCSPADNLEAVPPSTTVPTNPS